MRKRNGKVNEYNRYKTWWLTPDDERSPQTNREMAFVLNVSEQTLVIWGKDIEDNKGTEEEEFDEHLRKFAMKPNPNSKHVELYMKRQGMLVDKSEISHTFVLGGDEYSRIREQARAELREFHTRDKGAGE